MASIKDTLRLNPDSLGRAGSKEELTRRVNQLILELEDVLANINTAEASGPLGDLTEKLAYKEMLPIGNLAEMGGSGANKKINPKIYVYEIIAKIKKEIENFQSFTFESETNEVRVAWEDITIFNDLANKPLSEFPAIIRNLLKKINSPRT